MTDREDNDTSAQPQTQAMGAASGNPRGGEIPMRLLHSRLMCSRLGDIEDKYQHKTVLYLYI